MRNILAGGILVTPGAPMLVSGKPAYTRRRNPALARPAIRRKLRAPCSHVQPGQLASPYLRFGFPSLALH